MPANRGPALCLLAPLYGNSGAHGVIGSQIGNKVLFLSGLLKACVNFLLEVASCSLAPEPAALQPLAGQEKVLRPWFSPRTAHRPVSGRIVLLSVTECQPGMHFLPGFPERLSSCDSQDRLSTLPSGTRFPPISRGMATIPPQRAAPVCLAGLLPFPLSLCCFTSRLWLGMRQ